ncbi:MAG: hypothetical protein ACK5JM_13480 [Rhodoblastus sp.]
MRPSPLQNRVDPFGEIRATPERGLLFGNRGGRFHADDGRLTNARWKSRAWIVCLCAFKGRRKQVFGPRYTDLFFLDEPTAFAAGHRPCFECRRDRALAYRNALDPEGALCAGEIDRRLDAERRTGRAKRLHERPVDMLPDGAIFAQDGRAFAIKGESILPWSFAGYGAPAPRPRKGVVACLTPPTSLAVLMAGYAPLWRTSAQTGAQIS